MTVAKVPGTVSKILWHFTGGPAWNDTEDRQERRRKSPAAAFDALLGILSSRELRLGRYSEVIKVRVRTRTYDRTAQKFRSKPILTTIRSAPVCCLADIPIAHLSYHAHRYGKFAIGFHRAAVIKHGFNPVLYTLHGSDVLASIHEGFACVEYPDLTDLRSMMISESEPYAESLSIRSELKALEADLEEVRDSIRDVFAFTKTFEHREFQTIYSEREWRSVRPYRFAYSDVAMLVVPKREGRTRYYSHFLDVARTKINVPQAIPVVAWEDLVES